MDTSVCNDASLASVLAIVKNILTIIQIIGPILSIIFLSFHFFKLMRDPDNKKLMPKIKNSMIALVVLFFIPLLVDVVMGLVGSSTTFTACWNSTSKFTIEPTYQPIESTNKHGLISSPGDYQKGSPKPSPSPSNSSSGTNTSSSGTSTTPIDVTQGGSIVKEESSDTLKVKIEKISTYYITRIWAKDPYSQLNKYDSPKYGEQLLHPGYLLKTAISSKGLSNKIVVGFNASGFYLKDTYDADSVRQYPAYNKTSVGTLVITDGQVVRNAYDHAVKTWYTIGIDRSNTLRIFTDAKDNADAKKKWSETVIGTIRNTFTFRGPLVVNGSASSEANTMPSPGAKLKRQAICQIDSSNFILITGTNLTCQNLIDIMLANKCQTGFNLDGGGSIALVYKAKNSQNVETIIGNGRDVPEVGYFTE